MLAEKSVPNNYKIIKKILTKKNVFSIFRLWREPGITDKQS